MLNNWYFQNVVPEKTLESPLDCKEIKPVNPKRNQPWIFIGRTDAAAEAPIVCPPDVRNLLTGKDSDAGKDWEQEKGMTKIKWFNGITESVVMSVSKLRKIVKDREAGVLQSMGLQRIRPDLATEQQ